MTLIGFRTTEKMDVDLDILIKSGQWSNRSELIRSALWIGIKELIKRKEE